MGYRSIVKPLIYFISSSFYAPPRFWGFDVSPLCISIKIKKERVYIIREKVAGLPKDKLFGLVQLFYCREPVIKKY
jgi:hypothetical protein